MNVDSPIVNTLSLCSGVGMLDMGVCAGLEYLGFGTRATCYCEWESYAQTVLLERMEDAALEPAPICSDMADIDGRFRGLVDLIVAGFSCQPWSVAGAQRGIDDERWIWPDIFRVIRDVEPGLVFLENVPGLISGGGLEYVLSDLAALGFDAQCTCLTAAAVGAPHKRERVFILAYLADAGCLNRAGRRDTRDLAGTSGAIEGNGQQRERLRNAAGDGEPTVADALRLSGWERPGRERVLDGGENVADTSGARGRLLAGSDGRAGGTSESEIRSGRVRRQQRATVDEQSELRDEQMADSNGTGLRASGIGQRGAFYAEQCGNPLFPPGPGDRDGWLRILESQPWLAPAVESGVHLLVDGRSTTLDASRADQLRCAGNGCVPAVAAVALCYLLRKAGLA